MGLRKGAQKSALWCARRWSEGAGQSWRAVSSSTLQPALRPEDGHRRTMPGAAGRPGAPDEDLDMASRGLLPEQPS